MKWNERKCAVIQAVKRGQESGDMNISDLKPIKSLDQHNSYKFLDVFENTKQEDKQVLEAAAKTYLERLSIIWSSPCSPVRSCIIRFTRSYILDVDTNLADSKHPIA